MIEEVEGIVLSETNYSESSKILNILTKEHKTIGVMSKGCRNMKSKLRGVSRKMIYGKFYIHYKENGVSTLTGVDVINSFNNIITDLEKVSYASLVIDLVNQVSRQNDDEGLFDLLKDTLIKIDEGYNPLVLTNIIEIKLLDYLGVKPVIDCCGICGSTKNIVSLSSSSGGYVCANCYTNEGYSTELAIKLIRMFYYVDIKNIEKLDIDNKNVKEVNDFLDDYYDRYTGIYLKSKNFLKQIERINN